MVNIDVSCYINGFHGDNRCPPPPSPPALTSLTLPRVISSSSLLTMSAILGSKRERACKAAGV
eukprot:3111074-Rhodomonas_salina.2